MDGPCPQYHQILWPDLAPSVAELEVQRKEPLTHSQLTDGARFHLSSGCGETEPDGSVVPACGWECGSERWHGLSGVKPEERPYGSDSMEDP